MAAHKKIKNLLAALALLSSGAAVAAAEGRLVIVGGGAHDDVVMGPLVKMAGGQKARIVILPQASGEPLESARDQAAQFVRLGAASADWVIFKKGEADKPENLAKFKGANMVFFTGGDQVTLVSLLAGTRMLQEVRRIYAEGGIVSGTSAGAAVMSRIMLTGDDRLAPKEDDYFNAIRSSAVVTAEGFGFVPDNIVIDQHFIKRKRQNRLISVVLEHPGTTGIGIDENTALVVNTGGNCSVIGDSLVTVFETDKAGPVTADARGHLAASAITMRLLKDGDTYVLPQAGKAQ
jgi:cyanophycinase